MILACIDIGYEEIDPHHVMIPDCMNLNEEYAEYLKWVGNVLTPAVKDYNYRMLSACSTTAEQDLFRKVHPIPEEANIKNFPQWLIKYRYCDEPTKNDLVEFRTTNYQPPTERKS